MTFQNQIDNSRLTLLAVQDMQLADREAIDSGIEGYTLMKCAAQRVFDVIRYQLDSDSQVLLVAGSGNNGGDALVLANLLHAAEIATAVVLLSDPNNFHGDAAFALADLSTLPVVPDTTFWQPARLSRYTMIIDGIFGTGLNRAINEPIASVIRAINASNTTRVSIDIPSGINGDTGTVPGNSASPAIQADVTVTFHRLKPLHLLQPARSLCGSIHLGDIGIPADFPRNPAFALSENHPDCWFKHFCSPEVTTHKYLRGHALVIAGGPWSGGAARLAAQAALRIGAGLVTLACPETALSINACHLNEIMLCSVDSKDALIGAIESGRVTSLCIGPAAGVNERTQTLVLTALANCSFVVLDADALTVFSDAPDVLFSAIKQSDASVVLTPHTGEFQRLFGQASNSEGKWQTALSAARQSGATIVFKGPDTVIASPTGQARINHHASLWLATAGSGDVLAGTIAGLGARGVNAFDAASAAVWIHGDAGLRAGAGLIAGDLPQHYPAILQQLLAYEDKRTDTPDPDYASRLVSAADSSSDS